MATPASPAFTRLDPDGRRRQIVDAARDMFIERPYPAVSMNDIAGRAGVTRGLVHHYFGGKTQLFGAVLMSLAEPAPSQIVPDSDSDLTLDDVVAIGVDAWLDFVEQLRELALTIGAAGMYPDDPALEKMIGAAREEIVRRIISNLTSESPPTDKLRFLIRSYLGLADAAAREWLFHKRASREDVRLLLTRSLTALMRDALPALTR